MSQKSYSNNKSTLFIIPTPIGNMDDITIRALNTLKELDIIFSEDTRVTKQLLSYYDIPNKKLISSHNFNESKNDDLLLKYLNEGKNVGVVTDRGTPIISDPGYELVKIAINNDFNVVSLPGPTALIPALTASGLNPSPFIFYGFLNSKESKRKKELEKLKKYPMTLIFYEAPHRLINTLDNIKEVLGNRKISISREISKKFEEYHRDIISNILKVCDNFKGEMVIVCEGNNEEVNYNDLSIIDHVNLYIKDNMSTNDAIKLVAKERNVAKSIIYKEYHNGK